MKRNPEIGNELEAISTAVANLSSKMPFRVPEGYFELFPDRMMLLIMAEMAASGLNENPDFGQKIGNSLPFFVPEGYFEGLSGNILSKIKNTETESAAAELSRISPMLSAINKSNPYSIPEGYFENLEIQAAKSQEPKIKGKVFEMSEWKKWQNYAAAAVITGLMAGAVYFLSTLTGNIEEQIESPVAKVQIAENDSLQVSPEALSSFLAQTNTLDEGEMLDTEEFISQNDLAILDINKNTIEDNLQDIQDDALEEYMHENPEMQSLTNSN